MPADNNQAEPSVGTPEPGGGGCLKLGWGCLPVLVAGFGLLPVLYF